MHSQLELRDPIHGFIQRSDLEARVIDTSVFQRLRGIKQLALANLVYPGAKSSRFDHSIGVMHVAGRLALQLLGAESTEKIQLVRLLLRCFTMSEHGLVLSRCRENTGRVL